MTDDHEHVGYLTWDKFQRFRQAVDDTRLLVPWLRVAGYLKSSDDDVRVHTSRDGHIGLPPTWMAAEEINRLMQEINQWPELEDVANDEYGAWLAGEFTREVETGNARWPHSDRPHRVNVMRCVACDQLTLRYHPPRHEGDRIAVRCAAKECRAFLDEDMFARTAALIEAERAEREQQRLAKDRGRRSRSGEVADDDIQVGA